MITGVVPDHTARRHSAAIVAKHGLDFDILSDPGNAYAAELGLRFALPEALRAIYSAFGIDLPKQQRNAG